MITLIERKCQNCGTRLTEFEAEEKQGLCMDCSKENEVPVEVKKFSLKDLKKK